DDDSDPSHPRNWPQRQKWINTLCCSMGGLVTLMSGAMLAPALEHIRADLHTSSSTANLILSIYVLAFGFGPLVLAPLTEIVGRKPVFVACGLFYVCFNTVAGFARTVPLVAVARFLSGLGGSAEFAVTNPTLSDCWRPSERGFSFALCNFIPLLGPALGPMLGGVVAQHVGWRWIFYLMSILDFCVVLLVGWLFKECYPPLVVGRSNNRGREREGDTSAVAGSVTKLKLSQALLRPLKLLAFSPFIQVMSVALAYNFGVLYIAVTVLASVYMDRFGMSESQAGLHYVGLVVGYTLASQVGGKLTDVYWRRASVRTPESRLLLVGPGSLLVVVGLLWWGWSAQHRLTGWASVDVGLGVFGCGIILSTQAMQMYVMESVGSAYVASASSASQVLRNVFAFAFPVFAPLAYRRLGYGWANSVLALAMLLVAVPMPLLLYRLGPRLR
ncbi:MFS general substrate transporter, partial [Acaromyces ingoldii]